MDNNKQEELDEEEVKEEPEVKPIKLRCHICGKEFIGFDHRQDMCEECIDDWSDMVCSMYD